MEIALTLGQRWKLSQASIAVAAPKYTKRKKMEEVYDGFKSCSFERLLCEFVELMSSINDGFHKNSYPEPWVAKVLFSDVE